MSEIQMRDAIFEKIIQILVVKQKHIKPPKNVNGQNNVNEWLEKFPLFTISSILCAHLMLYLSTIIQHMAYYRKKYLFFCHKLNGKRDPRMPPIKNARKRPLIKSKNKKSRGHHPMTNEDSRKLLMTPRAPPGSAAPPVSEDVPAHPPPKKASSDSDDEIGGRTDDRAEKRKKKKKSKKSQSQTMTSVIAYQNSLFTAKDFLQMLKDHEELIPKRSLYFLYMEKLVAMDSVKPFVPRAMPSDGYDDYEEMKKYQSGKYNKV